MTILGVNSPQAVKLWSAKLSTDAPRNSYFGTRFEGRGQDANAPICILTDLERDSGDTIKFDINIQLQQKPIYGDAVQEGTEEQLRFYQDSVSIDQVRCGVNAGGRMTRKRTLHDLRKLAKSRQEEWWGRWFDEAHFAYGAGAVGVDPEFIEDPNWTGFAGNALQAPDSDHLVFGGNATVKTDVDTNDIMNVTLIERLATKAITQGGGVSGIQRLVGVKINGREKFVLLMHPWNAYDLRTNTNTGQWLDIQKAAAGADGQKNPIFRDALGEIRGTVLHEHPRVTRFSDYGVGANVSATRSLFMGRQAMVRAHGSSGNGMRYGWYEDMRDNGNVVVISTHLMCGLKKTRFNGRDFGLFSVDCAAANPG